MFFERFSDLLRRFCRLSRWRRAPADNLRRHMTQSATISNCGFCPVRTNIEAVVQILTKYQARRLTRDWQTVVGIYSKRIPDLVAISPSHSVTSKVRLIQMQQGCCEGDFVVSLVKMVLMIKIHLREKKFDSRAALTGPWLCVVTWETIEGEMDTCSGVQMVTLWFGSLLRVSQLTESDNHDRRTHDLASVFFTTTATTLILQCHTTNATHTTIVQHSVLTSTTLLDVTAEIPLTVLHNHYNYTMSHNWCNSKVLQHSTLSSTSTLFDVEDSSFRDWKFLAWICVYISFIQKCFQTQGWMTHLSIKSWTESGWQNRSYFIVVVILQVIFPFKYYRNSHNRAGTGINTREYIWIGGKSAITFEYRVRGAAFCNDQTRIGWAIGCITVATWTISHDDQDIFCGFSLCFWTLWLWTLWLLFFISYLLELELKNISWWWPRYGRWKFDPRL